MLFKINYKLTKKYQLSNKFFILYILLFDNCFIIVKKSIILLFLNILK